MGLFCFCAEDFESLAGKGAAEDCEAKCPTGEPCGGIFSINSYFPATNAISDPSGFHIPRAHIPRSQEDSVL